MRYLVVRSQALKDVDPLLVGGRESNSTSSTRYLLCALGFSLSARMSVYRAQYHDGHPATSSTLGAQVR